VYRSGKEVCIVSHPSAPAEPIRLTPEAAYRLGVTLMMTGGSPPPAAQPAAAPAEPEIDVVPYEPPPARPILKLFDPSLN